MSESAIDRVFIVTTGEYSDYRINSVWTTREAAERKFAKNGDGEIEEFILDNEGDRDVVLFRANLNTDREDHEIVVEDTAIVFVSDVPQTYVAYSRGSLYGHGPFWYGTGYGVSPEHARKNLADALAKAKAEQIETGEVR